MKTELEILVETLKKAKRDAANDLAATIAFWAFFSIFPLLIGILTLSSHFLESSSLNPRNSKRWLTRVAQWRSATSRWPI